MAGDYTIWSYDHDLWRLGIMIACLAFATVVFENALHFIKWWSADRGHQAVREALHKATDELTVLGFFSFLLLLVLQLQGSNKWVKKNYMTFELAHVWIFVLGLLLAFVAIVWSILFAFLKRHYRGLASVTSDETGKMVCHNYGDLAGDEERSAAVDARLRTPRYLLHLFDPLRIFGKPRFEEAQEFLFLTRYFRWQHREAIAHAFGGHEGGHSAGGGHGDEHDGEDDSGWKGGRSSVLHTSGKKSGFGKLAAQAAATSSGVSSGLGEHSTSQLNVAELLAITINHHLGEHLEVSPLMWVCFCLLLGVYITIKEIDYAVQKKAGTFGHAGEMVTYETKYNELRARYSLQTASFVLSGITACVLSLMIVAARIFRRCVVPRVAARALGVELGSDARLDNVFFVRPEKARRGATSTLDDNNAHGGRGSSGSLGGGHAEEEGGRATNALSASHNDLFAADAVCSIFADESNFGEHGSDGPTFMLSNLAEAVACAGAPLMSADEIAEIVALECDSAIPPAHIEYDKAVNIIAAVLEANRASHAPEAGGHSGGGSSASPLFELPPEEGHGGTPALPGGGGSVQSETTAIQRAFTTIWRQCDVFLFWLSRMSFLIANAIWAYDLVAGIPEAAGSKKYSKPADWGFVLPSVALSVFTIFVLQPIFVGDVAFLSLFLGGDKHAMHHALTELHEKQQEGRQFHSRLVEKIIARLAATQRWREIERMIVNKNSDIVRKMKNGNYNVKSMRMKSTRLGGNNGAAARSEADSTAADIVDELANALDVEANIRADKRWKYFKLVEMAILPMSACNEETRNPTFGGRMRTTNKVGRNEIAPLGEGDSLSSLSVHTKLAAAAEIEVNKQHLRYIAQHFGIAMSAAQTKVMWRFIFPEERFANGTTLDELARVIERAVRHHAKETATVQEAQVLRELLRNLAKRGRAAEMEAISSSPVKKKKPSRFANRVSLAIRSSKRNPRGLSSLREQHARSMRMPPTLPEVTEEGGGSRSSGV